MAKEKSIINVNEVPSVKGSVADFLEAYKKQNPAKFAVKEKAGEFDALKGK